MMNVHNIEIIDVCHRYFHIDDELIKKYAFLMGVDEKIFMNRVISKEEAIQYIGQNKCLNRGDISSLSISKVPLRIDTIRDFMDEKIFTKENVCCCGWLFQYDPTPFANWYHDCFYYFIVNCATCQEIQHNRGLSDTINMQQIW